MVIVNIMNIFDLINNFGTMNLHFASSTWTNFYPLTNYIFYNLQLWWGFQYCHPSFNNKFCESLH
jgi:hypothetical protein